MQPQIQAAYGDWAEELCAAGYRPYFLSFMFEPLGGSARSVGAQILREIERVYHLHVTRVVRKPNSLSHLHERPVWLCGLDRPVFKHAKASLLDVAINDGLHGHAVAFYWPCSRLREDLTEHFEAHRDLYFGRQRPLMRIDVEPINTRPNYVTKYGFKSIGRGGLTGDDVLILPAERRAARARFRSKSPAMLTL